jgi:hypothetical protein
MRELYKRLTEAIAANHASIREPRVTFFWPLTGCSTGRKLLLVGRAVNGWTDGWAPSTLSESEVRASALERCMVASAGAEGNDPMSWVVDHWGTGLGYNTKTSAFWCVAREAVGQLGLANTDGQSWPSSIDWTNLCKVSPEEGRNPSASLERAQWQLCLEIFHRELELSRAAAVLFLTGWDWASPFLPELNEVALPASNRYVERAGVLLQQGRVPTPVVVAKHPERKPRAPFVAELAAAWRACADNCQLT